MDAEKICQIVFYGEFQSGDLYLLENRFDILECRFYNNSVVNVTDYY